MSLTAHPFFRPLLAVLILIFMFEVLKHKWAGRKDSQMPMAPSHADRLVVAHFMVRVSVSAKKLRVAGKHIPIH